MSVIINRAILHILNFHSGTSVLSQKELDLTEDAIQEFAVKHVEHSLKDAGRHHGKFLENSRFSQMLARYVKGEIDFISLSSETATLLYDQLERAEAIHPIDVIAVEIQSDEEQYTGFLCFENKVGYTHQVISGGDGISNEILRHYAILPNPSQKLGSFAFVRLSDQSIVFADKKRVVDGEETYVLPERVLQCSWQISSRETVKLVNKIATKVAEEHGANSTVAVSRAKSYIAENAETSELLSPMDMGQEIFAQSQVMQSEFRHQIREAGLEAAVPVDRSYAQKAGKNHRIRTDTGIEISIPVDYFDNEQYVEFINNPNGTLSIALKNIAKITNRQ